MGANIISVRSRILAAACGLAVSTVAAFDVVGVETSSEWASEFRSNIAG
jgi:hypothetical protein